MAPIDYSKWDHIDTDSDSDDNGKEPTQPTPPPAITPSPATAPSPTTTNIIDYSYWALEDIKPGQIQCVRLLCMQDRTPSPFEKVAVDANHPVFSAPISPVSARIGLPLRMFAEDPLPLPYAYTHPRRKFYDNQPATYIMIELDTGLAPERYQAGLGTVVVARSDRKPLYEPHLEAVWQFCDKLLYQYGEGDSAVVPERDITRAKFEDYYRQFKDEKAMLAVSYPCEYNSNWATVGSPYGL